MNTLSFSTHFATPEEAKKEWVVVDAAKEPVVGRLASKVAKIIRGKYKPCFTPNQDCGDNVIIINANQIQFTGAKWTEKEYITFSGYPGGQKRITPEQLIKKPFGYERIIRHAVKGMLPKGRLGYKLIKNLYIFDGPEHDKAAQQPKEIDITAFK